MALRALTLAALCVLLAASSARAGVPAWSAPTVVAPEAGLGDIGIDGKGALTAVWSVYGPSRAPLFMATRPPGHTTFGPPQEVAGADARVPDLWVGETGEAIVLWAEWDQEACMRQEPCPGSVFARIRGTDGVLRPAQELAGLTAHGSHSVAANQGGEAVAVWNSSAEGLGPGGVSAALRSPGGRFGAPQVVLPEGPEPAGTPRVAINERGDAVVAWHQLVTAPQPDPTSEGQVRIVASYRPAGGGFGPPEEISIGQNFDPGVAIDPDGTAVVGFGGRYVAVSSRPRSGGFGPPQRVFTPKGPGGTGSPEFTVDEQGNLLGWWSEQTSTTFPVEFDTWAAVRPTAAPGFLPATRLFERVAGPLMAFDDAGNLVAIWAAYHPEESLMATTFTRFGPREPPRELDPRASQPYALEVNRAGAAVAMYSNADTPNGGVMVLDRPADRSGPVVELGPLTLTPDGQVRATVACDEICRVRAEARVVRTRRAARGAAVVAARPRAKVLRPGTRAVVRNQLGRAARGRIRRALRAGRRVSVVVRMRAEDSAGNRRATTGRFRVRRR